MNTRNLCVTFSIWPASCKKYNGLGPRSKYNFFTESTWPSCNLNELSVSVRMDMRVAKFDEIKAHGT